MNPPEAKALVVWQPLTPRGVAAFGGASLGRLLLVQGVVALIAAATVVWFLGTRWFPVVTQGIDQLPQTGAIRSGRLDWGGASPQMLAENRFLALTVDLDHTGGARSPAQVQVEFGRTDCVVISLFGSLRGSYPRARFIAFNRPELIPWWGAWQPPILAMAGGAVMVGLMAVWGALATSYSLGTWLIGLFANRDLSLGGSWRLAGAALLPGALLLTGAIGLYGSGVFEILGLLIAVALHFAVGWVYVALGVWASPTTATALSLNPFTPDSRPPVAAAEAKMAPENPFRPSRD